MKIGLHRAVLPTILTVAALCGCGGVKPVPLCILHTNDVHGHISPERVPGGRLGGAAVLAGCVQEIVAANRAGGVPTLILDAGDIFMGTPEGGVSEGTAVTEVMNAVGYDAMVIGNHEFDHGVPSLDSLAASARFPLLGANVTNSATGEIPGFLKPYVIEQCGDLAVGVIGVITAETPRIVMPGKTGEIAFGRPADAIRECLGELGERGVRFVVVLSHCGLGEDRAIARGIPGIGVIIGGHTHSLLKKPVRVPATGTIVCQAGSSGGYLGKLSLLVDPRSGRVRKYDYELIPLTEGRCDFDPEVAAVVEKWRRRVGKKFDERVAESLKDIGADDDAESPLGDMITDCMREKTGAEIAFHNSYGIRNTLLKGEITYRDVYKVMPFDNTFYTMKLTGGQIRRILEKSLSLRDGLLQVSGLRVDYDPAAPEGKKVMRVTCGGEELDDGREYTVATNSYLAKGGDSFSIFRAGKEVRNTGIVDLDAFADCLREWSPLGGEPFRPARLIAH